MIKKIYIADDIDTIRLIIRVTLENAGYAIEEFPTGDALLKAFLIKPSDMVILDVMMPGSNGFVICRELRKISAVPIIMLTGRDSDLDFATSRDLGSDDYLVKPFEPADLAARVKAIFARKESVSGAQAVPKFTDREAEKLTGMLEAYRGALDSMLSRVRRIAADYEESERDSPIDRVSFRLKTRASIEGKLFRKGREATCENARKYVSDIAGIRIISPYVNDIGTLSKLIYAMPDVRVLREKDYVTAPKPSGYRSLHLVVSVSAEIGGKREEIPVELQIRTSAMDFWASLEHKVRYKFNGYIPQHLSDELANCAQKISELDERMYLIHDIISLINPND